MDAGKVAADGGRVVEEKKEVMDPDCELAAERGRFAGARLRFWSCFGFRVSVSSAASSSTEMPSSLSELESSSDASKSPPPSLSQLLARCLFGCTTFSFARCAPRFVFFGGIALMLMMSPRPAS